MALSLRLQAVLDLVRHSKILADIGTDHAYLPIEAVRAGLCQKAIACDINKGPLEIAAANIEMAQLSDRIETRLGDGLAPVHQNEADCIVISGMGGMRIWNILHTQQAKAQFAKKLILQPQHNLEELRRSLHDTGYEIRTEKLIYEDSRFYVILLAGHTGKISTWTEQEYFFGKHITESPHFLQYLEYHQSKIARYIQSIKDDDTRQSAETRLKWIKKRLCRSPQCNEEAEQGFTPCGVAGLGAAPHLDG